MFRSPCTEVNIQPPPVSAQGLIEPPRYIVLAFPCFPHPVGKPGQFTNANESGFRLGKRSPFDATYHSVGEPFSELRRIVHYASFQHLLWSRSEKLSGVVEAWPLCEPSRAMW
jgi:hypothetical protein